MAASKLVVLVSCGAVLFGACGGGDDDAGGDVPADEASAGDQTASDGDDSASSGDGGGESAASGGAEVGPPTQEAEPGEAWLDVDGERVTYSMAGSQHVRCEVGPDRIQVNFQTPEGHNLLVQASVFDGAWMGSITSAPGDTNTQWSTDLATSGGTFGVGDNAVSYEGTGDEIVDFDIQNATAVEMKLAVNCASPGGDPTATVGGVTYTFPVSGAQSFDCAATLDDIEISVNRLAVDGHQLEIDMRTDGDTRIGHVAVYTPEGNLTASIPPDGAGVTVDGNTVSFDGTFTNDAGEELPGTATATCP